MAIWIVEECTFPRGDGELESAVRQLGGEVRWLSVEAELGGRYGKWEPSQKVVFRGSFEAADSFRRVRPEANPGVIGEEESLRCSAYYPLIGDDLLNTNHQFVAYRELKNRWPELQDRFGSPLFIRPDSGAKSFSGQAVLSLDDFERKERPYLQLMDPDALFVVAPARQISAEWRLVVVNNTVVSGSQYRIAGKRELVPQVPADVHTFGQATASKIAAPAFAYMLDVALEASGRLSVVELNSFSCSDLYASNLLSVVTAVEREVNR